MMKKSFIMVVLLLTFFSHTYSQQGSKIGYPYNNYRYMKGTDYESIAGYYDNILFDIFVADWASGQTLLISLDDATLKFVDYERNFLNDYPDVNVCTYFFDLVFTGHLKILGKDVLIQNVIAKISNDISLKGYYLQEVPESSGIQLRYTYIIKKDEVLKNAR